MTIKSSLVVLTRLAVEEPEVEVLGLFRSLAAANIATHKDIHDMGYDYDDPLDVEATYLEYPIECSGGLIIYNIHPVEKPD